MAQSGTRNSYRWMVAPAVIFAAAMIVYPFCYALWLSFSDVQLGSDPRFIGLGNYTRMLADSEFWNGLKLTFFLYFMALGAQLVLGTWLGLLLARSQSARGLVRTVMVSPFMLPPVVIGMMRSSSSTQVSVSRIGSWRRSGCRRRCGSPIPRP